MKVYEVFSRKVLVKECQNWLPPSQYSTVSPLVKLLICPLRHVVDHLGLFSDRSP